jgi:uncharacterized damage-inducible protein DinB
MRDILHWVRAVLSTTPIRWESLTQNLPLELLSQRPTSGEWSALECLGHMVDVERVFQFRLQTFLEGRRSFPAFDPDRQGSQLTESASAQELVDEFSRLRTASLAALAGLTADDLNRTAQHQELGMVTLGEMTHEWAAHDLNHTVQAERALMQPFIQSCGPWQRYFTDHMLTEEQ